VLYQNHDQKINRHFPEAWQGTHFDKQNVYQYHHRLVQFIEPASSSRAQRGILDDN